MVVSKYLVHYWDSKNFVIYIKIKPYLSVLHWRENYLLPFQQNSKDLTEKNIFDPTLSLILFPDTP
jgi:hypothetical protein